MLRKTIKELGFHSIIYMIGGVASSLASIVLLPVYTRYLTTEHYGILEIIDSVRSLLVIILLAGFIPAMAKFYKEAETPQQEKEVAGTTFWFVLCFSVLWAFILFAYNDLFAEKLFGNVEFVVFINLTIFLLLTQVLFTTGENFLNVRKRSMFFVLASLVKLGLNIIANLYFIVVLGLGVRGMLYGELLSMGIVGAFIIGYLIKESRLSFRFDILKKMFAFGLPFIPNLMSAALMHRADRYLLQRFCSLSDVGIYGIGYRFPFMLNFLLLQSFTRIWNASVMYDVAKHEDAPKTYAKIMTYFVTIYAVGQYMLVVMAPTIMKVLAAPEYFEAWKTFQIVGLGMVFYCLHNFFTIGAFIKDKTWYLPIAYMASAVINIALNWYLLPRYGYIAAAWNTAITYGIFSLLGYIVFRKIYPIPFEFKRLAYLLVLGICLTLINNSFSLQSIVLNGIKQFAFALLLPTILFIGPYLTQDEKQSLQKELHNIHPKLASLYIWIQTVFKLTRNHQS